MIPELEAASVLEVLAALDGIQVAVYEDISDNPNVDPHEAAGMRPVDTSEIRRRAEAELARRRHRAEGV